ncbi:hypothetical protein B296_00002191 [Ensete ventricosum]|uniref:Uncharacterized protein n=1 Tax=Ensete ventricosum TaxID=4639 RepID=A0A427A6E7_ENSVE|nr:hypothetical protein B296_00002191 [Ensete ventricosum]
MEPRRMQWRSERCSEHKTDSKNSQERSIVLNRSKPTSKITGASRGQGRRGVRMKRSERERRRSRRRRRRRRIGMRCHGQKGAPVPPRRGDSAVGERCLAPRTRNAADGCESTSGRGGGGGPSNYVPNISFLLRTAAAASLFLLSLMGGARQRWVVVASVSQLGSWVSREGRQERSGR